MQKRSRVLMAGMVAMLTFTAIAPARADGPEDPPASERFGPADCSGFDQEALPAAGHDHGQTVKLRTLIVLDRVEPDEALPVVNRVISGFREVGIVLEVHYRELDLWGLSDANRIMDETRKHLAAAHVGGYDLVHVLTDAQITTSGVQEYGLVRCIGGIRYARYLLAMSVSQMLIPDRGDVQYLRPVPPITVYTDRRATVVAHEIAHVLGAGHWHGNCGEEAPAAALAGRGTVCTLMETNLQYRDLRFGAVERAVVRAFAIHYG